MSTFKDKNMLLKCLEIVHLQRKEAILKPPNWMKRFRTTHTCKVGKRPDILLCIDSLPKFKFRLFFVPAIAPSRLSTFVPQVLLLSKYSLLTLESSALSLCQVPMKVSWSLFLAKLGPKFLEEKKKKTLQWE